MRYRGIGVCAGMALNRAFRLAPLPQLDYELRAGCSAAEALSAYTTAADRLKSDFRAIAKLHAGAARAELMEVQLAMLEDDAFVDRIKDDIAAGYAPEAAVLRAARSFEQMLQAIDDEYMTARADDVHDLGMRLACGIANVPYPSLSGLLSDCVVLARDLLPSMLMTAELKYIRGIATENGTRTSHISILTAGLEIPTVVACTGVMAARHGEMVFLDGEQGVVEDDLDAAAVEALSAREREYQLERGELLGFAGSESVTADGAHIGVLANIVNTVSLDKVLSYRVDGVGLFRTEFLYMNRSVLPGEEEQFAIYSAAAQKLGGLPLTIRTMDIGGDKNAECLRLPKEENPFMGYRAVRISLDREDDVLMPQLRAILRAAQYGNIWVMFPMIAVKRELAGMLAVLEKARGQLRNEGVPFGEISRVGMMVEVPSAVLMLDHLAKLVDFVSIGSNDLTQYTYAVDRMNPRVGYLYDFFDPAVLRMIRRTIDVSAQYHIDCSLCGEMAGDALGLAVLVALGIRKVSVSPSGVLKTKKRLSMLNAAALREIGNSIVNAEDAAEALRLLSKVLPEDYPSERAQEP